MDAKAEAPIFGHVTQRADSLEKTLMLGKTEGKRSRGDRMTWLNSITNSTDKKSEQAPGESVRRVAESDII